MCSSGRASPSWLSTPGTARSAARWHSPVSPEEVDLSLPSQEALLLQIWEDVHERLVKDGRCLTKLVRRALNKSHGKKTRGQWACKNMANGHVRTA